MNKYGAKYNVSAKHLDLHSLSFSVFTADDVRNLSVKKITSHESFNNLGHPLGGGLYDPALGPVGEKADPCKTCGANVFQCPGHFGHIDLPLPVINPLFHKASHKILKLSCLKCFVLQIPEYSKMLLSAKLRLLNEGFFSSIEGLEQEISLAIPEINNSQDIDLTLVQSIINSYVENCHNRERFKTDNSLQETSKNLNMQWQIYLDSFLKRHLTNAKSKCINCHEPIDKITVMSNKIMYYKPIQEIDNDNQSTTHRLETSIMSPIQTREHLRNIWKNEKNILTVIFPCLKGLKIEYPTDVFFFEVIPVLPPVVRPINFLNGAIIDHPQSQVYKSIVINCVTITNIMKVIQDGDTNQLTQAGLMVFSNTRGSSASEKLHNAWQELQANADHLLDREMSKTSESVNCQGLKQVIEKKEGVMRMHMMGKRVNYAARSVITPDPNLNIDEIGVPETFAMKLTYAVCVNPNNVGELRQMVLNGPFVHPGAVMVESEDGFVTKLTSDINQRSAIAKRLLSSGKNKGIRGVKVVYRHLQNGDVLLLNRQPTLHKPSIMAHKARILKGEKTLRLHYANCKAYNADFDGDEMNAHFVQNEVARAEGYFIANVSDQYLVPKDGTPLSGLIQDHMISGVRLTLRGNFFNRQDYMQLVFSALSLVQGNLILLPPAILKPVPLWSGKQVLSTIIINIIPRGQAKINLTSTAKIKTDEWKVKKARPWKCGTPFSNPITMSEAEIIIRNGELLSGVLDKKHYGATSYSLIHCVFELYGGTTSSNMLSAFGKVFQTYLQFTGFTLGIEDILVKKKADIRRSAIIRECREIGDDVHRSVLELPPDTPMEIVTAKIEESYWTIPNFRAQVDRKYKSAMDVYTNQINKTCLPAGLIKPFPSNNLQMMVQSGAKGSTVNTMQISCLLGQIELEGKRPPLMISGKSLPSFRAHDPSPRAGGFIDGRFMTGIQPQEFFFHCMAGREGLIDTAVKTSSTGYLQRCLIKHMEGISIKYDSTVRDSDGSLIQTLYGEDGLDVTKSRFLNDEQMQFLIENKEAITNKELLPLRGPHKEVSESPEISKYAKKIMKWQKKNGDPLTKIHKSAFSKFSAENHDLVKKKAINQMCGRSKASISLMKKWLRCDDETKKYYLEQVKGCPDPTNSRFNTTELGVLSEKLEKLLNEHHKKISTSFISNEEKNEIRKVLCAKVRQSLCPPGEPVGLLAAQSVGEPSTQMTLNTFHFAGRGEMNVTLGIPRLREILMTASKTIKTPSMEIPFNASVKNLEKQSNKVRLKLTKCYLSDVLQSIVLNRKLSDEGERQLHHTFMIDFLPHEYYKDKFCVRPQDIIKKTEILFFKEIFREIQKSAKKNKSIVYFKEEKTRTKVEDSKLDENDLAEPLNQTKMDLGEMHESSDEEEIAEDADATTTKVVFRHQENVEYEDPESGEEEPEEDEDNNDIITKEEKENSDIENEDEYSSMDECHRSGYQQTKLDVINMYPHAIDYDYDSEKYQWCKIKIWLPMNLTKLDIQTIVKKVAKKIVLWETPSIKKAFTFQNNKGETILKTDGINIVEMFKYNKLLDLERLYTNDIYAISQTYGIEAANRVIIREVKDVFKMYGIAVDSRHLSLIADYMTYDGTFQPLSRKGMEVSSSPLQQMTYESSLTFLTQATLQAKCDHLSSPSSRLMVGQPCKSGTGSFDLLVDLRKYLNPFKLTKPLGAVKG